MARRLTNYLRTHRKRAGLSQKDVSYLLGCATASKVSRYERFVRELSLRTALAYEAVFQTPACELFAGMYDDIRRAVRGRAEALLGRLQSNAPRLETARKLEVLGVIAEVNGR